MPIERITVAFAEMRPIEDGGTPALDRIDSVLFVVDTTNTIPGTTGTVWIGDVRVEK